MNQKAKKLKRDLGIYKIAGIVNIVVAIILWIGVVFHWVMLRAAQESLPWHIIIPPLVTLILLGVFLLVNGILTLHVIGRVDEFLKDVSPDED